MSYEFQALPDRGEKAVFTGHTLWVDPLWSQGISPVIIGDIPDDTR